MDNAPDLNAAAAHAKYVIEAPENFAFGREWRNLALAYALTQPVTTGPGAVDALEMAAEECDKVHAARHKQGEESLESAGAQACANAIRALLRKQRAALAPGADKGGA